MAFPRDPKIQAIYEALRVEDSKTAQSLAQEAMGPIETTLQAQSALAHALLAQGNTEEAVKEAEAAVERAREAGDEVGEAIALNSLGRLYTEFPTPDAEKAHLNADKALKKFQNLNDALGQADVCRTMVKAHLAVEKNPEARQNAQDFVDAYKKGTDRLGTGACLVVLSEACLSTSKYEEAAVAAKEAAQIFKEIGDKRNQAFALFALISTDMMSMDGGAVPAAQERLAIYKELGDQAMEAEAMSDLAYAHTCQVCLRKGTCSIPSTEHTMAGLRTAKDAYALYTALGDRDGMELQKDNFVRIMMYNDVGAMALDNIRMSDLEETYQDVVSGKYSRVSNAFPPAPQVKQQKVEDIIPTYKQLDRSKFQWQYPNAGFSYTLIWQSVKERNVTNKKPRGAYNLMTLNTGTKSTTLAQAFTAMCTDANEKSKALVIYMTSQDHNTAYATNIISQQSTMACMITARLSQLTFVQFGEGHFDWTDIRARQVNMYPVTVALARSCRIEAPTVNIGFVGGDAASWMSDPLPLVENLFDTLESDECEVMYRRGEAYGPLIVHRPMEEGVTYVKAKKGLTVFYK